MRWFTADLHLSHVNIVKLANRPFSDWQHMDHEIITRWNACVAPTDEVYVLGDVALGRIADSLMQIRDLNGTKHLITGNHDRCWYGHPRIRPIDVLRYHQAGFASITHQMYLPIGDHLVLLSHLPYEGDSHTVDRYPEHRPSFHGLPMICGHVHESWKIRPIHDTVQINVGVDVWNFEPVPETVLATILKDFPTPVGEITIE